HPVIIMRDQAYVGGQTFDRRGGKIADFVLGHGLSDNLAIVEIKTPATVLLGKKYRGSNVFSAGSELSGAIVQVLDQRHELVQNFPSLAMRNKQLRDSQPTSIKCIVVAGKMPEEPERRRSLDLFRHASRDVDIITFDELLIRLRQLRAIIGNEDAHAQSPVKVGEPATGRKSRVATPRPRRPATP
ncbi:MAG: DUF4263 domain-containing protein, partial [Pseudomonadota bacterium]|nr:DUF4263 domain-containing protein [Pseudomonadota bacterium]